MDFVKEVANDALGRNRENAPGTHNPHQDEKTPAQLAAEQEEHERKHHYPNLPNHPPGDYNRPL